MSVKYSKEYTCFFITPIGQADSPTRKNSDLVLGRLITPALRQCGFLKDNIIRSDTESKPGRISDRIDQHIRNDDLCIVDLTGLNANVMYEYGMRRGIGKPIIVIAQKGQELPFDTYDENTIFYDDSSIDAFFTAQEQLEGMIGYWKDKGFVSSEGEGSVSDITKRLRSIEDKLDSVLSARSVISSTPSSTGSNDVNELLRKLGPIGAFNYALRQRDVILGEELMPRLEQTVDKDKYIDAVISQLAVLGSEKAGSLLRAEWPYITNNFTFEKQYEALGCYVSYCNRRDIEPENIDFILQEAVRMLNIAQTPKEKAGVYNQMNRIYFGAYSTLKSQNILRNDYLQEAIQSLQKATGLCPDEASYFYNLAFCYNEQGESERALESITACLDICDDDEAHLSLAYQIYKAHNSPRADEVYSKLKKVNRFRAEMLI